MTSQRLKQEFHLFLLTDYEEEEAFLRKRHNEGYRLVKIRIPGIYYFEKCEPADVVYKLDFNPQSSKNISSYLQMYKDYGWKYIQDLNDYSYFRKPAANTSEEDLDIFNDNTSRLDMLFRIFKLRMLPFLAIFFLCVLPGLNNVLWAPVVTLTDIIYLLPPLSLFLMHLCIILHCGIGFYRLRKKYGSDQ